VNLSTINHQQYFMRKYYFHPIIWLRISILAIKNTGNFIQNLFDGESSHLDQVIQFIDHEANKSTDWKSILQTKYSTFQRVDNQELWNELYKIIERKFS
jgi:hypothetical protein